MKALAAVADTIIVRVGNKLGSSHFHTSTVRSSLIPLSLLLVSTGVVSTTAPSIAPGPPPYLWSTDCTITIVKMHADQSNQTLVSRARILPSGTITVSSAVAISNGTPLSHFRPARNTFVSMAW